MTLNAIWDNPVFKKRKEPKVRLWTESDLAELKEMYENRETLHVIAEKLNRTQLSIKTISKKMNLVRSSRYSDSEMQYIKENMEIKSYKEIAKYLERSEQSVRNKIRRLNE